MIRYRFLLAVLLMMTSWALAAQDLDDEVGVIRLDPDEVRQHMAGTSQDLVDVNNQTTVLRHLRGFQESVTHDEQRQVIFELSEYCRERGLRPAPDLAELFLSLADEYESQKRMEEFRRMTGFAETFDPTHPAVHLSRASVALRQHSIFSGEFLFETLNALILSFQSSTTFPVALANVGYWFRITTILLLIVLALLLLLRYQSLIRHDVQEWMGGQDTTWAKVAGWVVIFLPSLVFLSGFWWIIYWCTIFLLYATRAERFTILIAILLFLGGGAFQIWTEQELYVSRESPHVSNLRSYANRMDIGPDAQLATMTGVGEPDRDTYAFLLGSRYLVHGSYLKAEEVYNDMLKRDPGNAGAANNLGCILFYQMRYQEAVVQFTRAIEARGDLAVAYFNRSLANNKLFIFTEAEADRKQAQALDRHISKIYASVSEEDWVPMPYYLPLRQTRNMAFERISSEDGRRTFPYRTLGGWVQHVTRPAFSLPLLVFLIVVAVFGMAKGRDFFAKACYKCGRPYCAQCKTSLEFESFCAQCVHLYIKQDGVSPEARLRKNYEVEVHKKMLRIVRTILSAAAPGAGHFVEGRPMSSLFILFLWCGLLGGFLLKSWALPYPFPTPADPLSAGYNVFGTVCMAALWLIFGLPKALSPSMPHPVGYTSSAPSSKG